MTWEKIKNIFGFEEELLESSPLKIPNKGMKRKERPTKKARVIDFPKETEKKPLDFAPNDIVIIEPRVYEDSLNVSTYLKRGNPVIINIKNLDAETGKRFIDFICGSAYAYEGHMHRLSGTSFLFTPSDIGIIPVSPEDEAPYRPNKGNIEEEMAYDEGIEAESPVEVTQSTSDYEYYDPAEQDEAKEVLYA